jgi:hypothetical protein
MPEDFALKLRRQVFKSQTAAAHYHGVNRSTISKYERFDYEHYQHRIVPPVGYLASLMRLIVEQTQKAGASEAELDACKEFFLGEIKKLLAKFPVEYGYMEPFHNWTQLCLAADSYLRDHTRRQTVAKTPDTCDSAWQAHPHADTAPPVHAHTGLITALVYPVACPHASERCADYDGEVATVQKQALVLNRQQMAVLVLVTLNGEIGHVE